MRIKWRLNVNDIFINLTLGIFSSPICLLLPLPSRSRIREKKIELVYFEERKSNVVIDSSHVFSEEFASNNVDVEKVFVNLKATASV